MIGKSALFGLLAMLPAMANTVPARAAGMLSLPVCSGDGVARTVDVPVPASPVRPSQGDSGCCVKGCHAPSSRKRGQACHI